MPEDNIDYIDFEDLHRRAISQPLVKHIYTADPSAHVFEDRIYIYPSHDVEANVPFDDLGSHFAMRDYHVFSMDEPGGEVTDHGMVLSLEDIPWASEQLWAPDAAYKDGLYYLFFPAKDLKGVFRIGVATSPSPGGPFTPQPEPMAGSFSIDPAVFAAPDGEYYMYFGGIWGGQLQRWRTGTFQAEGEGPFVHLPADHEPALCPKVVRLRDDLLEFDEEPRDMLILDENGEPLKQGDTARRFFEAPWLHRYNDLYYFSYSTGDSHYICYATSTNPYGPFTYRGRILNPVVGWTTHHSIMEFRGKWYLFYHDSSLSEGMSHLRSIKMTEIYYDADGNIKTIDPYLG